MSSKDTPTEPVEPAPVVEINARDILEITLTESWIKSQRIETPSGYWKFIVKPDYEDFLQNRGDLRRAFHCALSLFHLSDWIYINQKPQVDNSFTYKDGKGTVCPVNNERQFANALADLHPDFDLIRGIANAAKHLKLRPRTNLQPAVPNHAANVSIQTTGYGQRSFGRGAYGGTPRVMLAGPGGKDLEFSALAASTFEMWQNLSQQHGWQLT